MESNQPNKSQSDNPTKNISSDTPSNDKVYTQEAVNKVVDRLNKLGALEDPNKTWTPPQKEKPNLSLT